MHEITGSLKHKTSRAALDAYNSYYDVRDMDKNKQTLKGLDEQIEA